MDSLLLSRVQFAFAISFHIVFPALTIGIAAYLVILKGLWLKYKDNDYHRIFDFWTKVFALCFGMGVVSGVVMAYQFGTNWKGFSEFAGAITGPLLTYEVLTAFFLEAGFLGVMVFGRNRISDKAHFFATCMVAVGTIVSSFWILASNSWMQTPQGHLIVNGVAVPDSWWEIIFNPSFPFRLTHMVTATFLSAAFLIAGTAAWHLKQGHNTRVYRHMLSMALWLIVVLAPTQIFIGDLHGLNTLKHQPAKIAAMEGNWAPPEHAPAGLILFGWPDMKQEKTRYKVEIPYLGSLILRHDINQPIPSLKSFPPELRPNSTIIFWTFRLMVGLGLLMLFFGMWSIWLRYKKQLYRHPLFLKGLVFMAPSGIIAILAGWYTTEIGRQPWVVYGLLKTADAVSSHSIAHNSLTLTLFIAVYFFVFGSGTLFLVYLLRQGIKK